MKLDNEFNKALMVKEFPRIFGPEGIIELTPDVLLKCPVVVTLTPLKGILGYNLGTVDKTITIDNYKVSSIRTVSTDRLFVIGRDYCREIIPDEEVYTSVVVSQPSDEKFNYTRSDYVPDVEEYLLDHEDIENVIGPVNAILILLHNTKYETCKDGVKETSSIRVLLTPLLPGNYKATIASFKSKLESMVFDSKAGKPVGAYAGNDRQPGGLPGFLRMLSNEGTPAPPKKEEDPIN